MYNPQLELLRPLLRSRGQPPPPPEKLTASHKMQASIRPPKPALPRQTSPKQRRKAEAPPEGILTAPAISRVAGYALGAFEFRAPGMPAQPLRSWSGPPPERCGSLFR